MIARVWRGRTRSGDAATYLRYVERTGVAAQRETKGNLGSFVLTRPGDRDTEFVVLSLWESMEAVKRFAGDEPERAVYYPEDRRYLLDLAPAVEHYGIPVARLESPALGTSAGSAMVRGAWLDGAWSPPLS